MALRVRESLWSHHPGLPRSTLGRPALRDFLPKDEFSLTMRLLAGWDFRKGHGSFDVVTSTFGVMFVARPEDAARELARVCKKGGRLGICTWPPGDIERCGGSTVSSLICGEV